MIESSSVFSMTKKKERTMQKMEGTDVFAIFETLDGI